MIVSPGRNYIFVHIPKTGGTSLAAALEGRAMKDDLLIGDTPKARRRRGRLEGLETAGRLWKHSSIADIEGLMPGDWIARAFVFTLVRNPWDRMVSYYHWLRMQRFDHPAVEAAKATDFAGFLRLPATQGAIRAHPYARYVEGAATPVFIRLEHFEHDAEPLWDHLGFRLELPHLNRSERAPSYAAQYDAETRAIVDTICAEDIARFGYDFLH
ncbi:sulfotransferase family 2 domain-containing protein [Roseovarius aquimarinus]|uniref:Sulfotransferase family 2 domain-containing protein n=1 Tax=Roseovarius aquimarinus TaxID=1229156 RepID=A0ABW7I788_9RHOB